MSNELNKSLGINTKDMPPQVSEFEEGPAVFLQRIRALSCYQTLRGLLLVGTVIACLAVIVGTLWFIGKIVMNPEEPMLIIGPMVGGVLAMFLVVGAYQASSLLIDIADTLIEQNRRKS